MDVLLASWQPYTMSHDWTMPDGFEVHVKVMVPVDTKIEVDELDHASFVYRHEVNAGTEKGLSIAANTVHSVDAMVVREMARRCNYDYEILRYFQMLFTIILRGTPEEIVEYQPIEQLWRDSGFLSLVGIEHMLTERKIHKKYSHAYLTKLLQLIERTLSRKSFALLTIHDEFKAHANNINVVRQTYAEIMAEIAYSRMLESLLSQIHKKPITFEKYSENLGELILEGNYALS